MRIKKTAIAMMMFLAIAMIASVNFAGAQVYTPLVQIPGLPPGAVNLSMYLVGLYDFLLSIVGIVAVMMLIIGGMRYITAAGNQAAVSDAKDIITNALAGLLLAILSWVIVAEINPDVLYIKKPGAGFTSADNVDWGKCGDYDAVISVCTCKDGTVIALASDGVTPITNQSQCDNECRLQDYCNIEGTRCFAHQDINGPYFHHPSEDDWLGQDGECICIDGEQVAPVGGANCQTTCLDPANYHCLVADLRVGHYESLMTMTNEERMEKLCIYNSPEEIPLTFTDNLEAMICADKTISNNPIASWEWDFEADGVWDMLTPANTPYVNAFNGYLALAGGPAGVPPGVPTCKLSNNPEFVLCPIKLRATDTAVPPNTSEDILWVKVLAP